MVGEGREGGEEESRVVTQMVSTTTSTGTHHLIWQGRGGEEESRMVTQMVSGYLYLG